MNKFAIVNKYKDAGLVLPQPATPGSAGMDIRAAADVIIPPFFREQYGKYPKGENLSYTLAENENNIVAIDGKFTLIPTGLKVYLDEGYFLMMAPRSSFPLKNWLFVSNTPAIIDRDYVDNKNNEGEIFVQIANFTPNPIQIKKGDKIAQAIIVPYTLPNNVEPENSERVGGFGSTDTTCS